jgi:hypothetical protein
MGYEPHECWNSLHQKYAGALAAVGYAALGSAARDPLGAAVASALLPLDRVLARSGASRETGLELALFRAA